MRLSHTLLILFGVLVFIFIIKQVIINNETDEMVIERSQSHIVYNFLNHTNICDRSTLWPTKKDYVTHSFSNSTAVFNYFISSKYSEYYDMNNLRKVFFNTEGVCKWSIYIPFSDKIPDDIPVIISANIDIQKLITLMTSSQKNRKLIDTDLGTGVIQQQSFKRFGCVLIRPEFSKTYATGKYNPLKGDRFNWPSEIFYITPTGMVKVIVGDGVGSKKSFGTVSGP